MNKNDLINVVRDNVDITKKDAEIAVNSIFNEITKSLVEGDKVKLIGFGTFEVRKRAARKARNPQTGDDIEIPASKAPIFRAGRTLRDAVK